MHNQQQKQTDVNRHNKRHISRDQVAVLLGIVALILWALSSFWYHARGEDWTSAIGLTADRDFFRILGDFVIPVVAVVFMMQFVRKLPPSHEKTAMTWIGWMLFAYLFVWWSPLHIALFGPG